LLLADNEDTRTGEQSFLDELRYQFDRENDLRKTLDTKATTMITIATTMITINLAIGTFLISKMMVNYTVYYTSIGILILAIIFSIKGILKLIKSYELKDYDYPIGHKHFFENNDYDMSMIDGVRNITEKQFNDRMFKGYLKSIKTSDELNTKKSIGIREGQSWIVRTLITIIILLAFVLIMGF
jgi:hypothetical protein